MITAITGASKGIGKALAIRFAKSGSDLAICARNKENLEKLKAQINSEFPDVKVLAIPADVSSKEDIKNFGKLVRKEMGVPDLLINNAGAFIPGITYEEEDGSLESQIETNLYSAYYMTREFVLEMIKRGSGHVINMCSIASIIAYPNGGSYGISKFALLGYTKSLREELKDKNIRVTAILPGATFTASWEGVDIPENRLMPAEDVAETVFTAWNMSDRTVMEEVILRPREGDL